MGRDLEPERLSQKEAVSFSLRTWRDGVRIIIVGLAKSGTTALCFKIGNSLNDPFILVEPPSWDKTLARRWRRWRRRHGSDVVAKLVIGKGSGDDPPPENDGSHVVTGVPLLQDYASFDQFDKKVMIVRDPRDVVVSHLLYRAGYHVLWNRSRLDIHKYLDLLRRKESAPQSVSILPLLAPSLDMAYFRIAFDATIAFRQEHQDYFFITYEDFICGHLAPLEAYLEVPLLGAAEVGHMYSRVARTKASGSWRKWFSQEDVEFFKPLLAPYMATFGYDSEDWEVGKSEPIPSIEGSDYVKKILDQRRQEEGLEPIFSSSGDAP